jgi:hypothetical protein
MGFGSLIARSPLRTDAMTMEQSSGAYRRILPRMTIGVNPGISVLPRRHASTLLKGRCNKEGRV